MTLRVSYLVGEPAISSALRLALAQADALVAHGAEVRLVATDAPTRWHSFRAEWVEVGDLRQYEPRDDDAVVGTTAETIALARDLGGKRAVALVADDTTAAAAAGMTVIATSPAFVVENGVVAGLVVDDVLFRSRMPREREPLRVLLSGSWSIESHGLDDGYGAVAHARWFHQTLELVRVSPWVPSREEPLDAVQEFHTALSAAEMTRLIQTCDVAVVPSHASEGLRLWAAEALAAGLAVLMTETPAHLLIDPAHDYARFAPEWNAVELGERLIEVLSDFDLRAGLRDRGRAVAEQWRAEVVGPRLFEFLEGRRTSNG